MLLFRTGGDEFVMLVKSDSGSRACKLYNFYNKVKGEINGLGSRVSEFIGENEWKETETKLSNATDRQGNKINLNIVGLSCGIFMDRT